MAAAVCEAPAPLAPSTWCCAECATDASSAWTHAAACAGPSGSSASASADEDEEVADYVKQLEEARDAADLPEASGEAIAREFERYLRRRGADDR